MDILKEHIELPIRQYFWGDRTSTDDRIQFYSRGKGKIGPLLAGRIDVSGLTGYGG
jgi:hypothetical protein